MSPRNFFSRKIPGYIALILFATLLSGVLMFYSQAALTGSVNNTIGLFFTLITDSAGNPGFAVTVIILMSAPVILKMPKQHIIKIGIQFTLFLVLCMIAKTAIKHITEIPRPYTYQLQALGIVESPDIFYQMDESQQQTAIKEAGNRVSHWRTDHWKSETNYSFPSGHTIFAAACVTFWGGFFLRRRHYLPAAGVITWGVGVGISRVWLGMHWPTDLMAALFCAAILYLCVPEWPVDDEKN